MPWGHGTAKNLPLTFAPLVLQIKIRQCQSASLIGEKLRLENIASGGARIQTVGTRATPSWH